MCGFVKGSCIGGDLLGRVMMTLFLNFKNKSGQIEWTEELILELDCLQLQHERAVPNPD